MVYESHSYLFLFFFFILTYTPVQWKQRIRKYQQKIRPHEKQENILVPVWLNTLNISILLYC